MPYPAPSFAEMKKNARFLIHTSKPNVITVGAIYCILTILLSFLSSELVISSFTASKYQYFMNYLADGDIDRAMQILSSVELNRVAVVINLLLEASRLIISVGFDIFLLRTLRGNDPSFGNLLDGFGFFWRILLLEILRSIFIMLWSFLFIIPGIIASYSYNMATYLLIDYPEYSAIDCLRESKRMMRGHKMELFALYLSFIGWIILVYLGFIPGLWILSGIRIWVVPYMAMTYAIYYETIRCGGILPPLPTPNPGYRGPGNR